MINFIRNRIHFRWQNLSADDAKDTGRRPLHGRAWWRTVGDAMSMRAEWNILGRSHPALSYEADDMEGEYQFHVAVPGVSLWLSASRRKWWPKANRKIGVDFHDGGIWWCLWMNPDEWSSKDSKFRRGVFRPLEFVFGSKQVWRRDVTETRAMLVPMPEGPYLAEVKMERYWFGYKRLPKRQNVSAYVDVKDNPIPHSGKGENSWDCGEDATYGLSCAASTPEDAVGKLVASVMRTRRERGDPTVWPKTPAEQHAARMAREADDPGGGPAATS